MDKKQYDMEDTEYYDYGIEVEDFNTYSPTTMKQVADRIKEDEKFNKYLERLRERNDVPRD